MYLTTSSQYRRSILRQYMHVVIVLSYNAVIGGQLY